MPFISYPNHSPPVINIPGIVIFKYEILMSFVKYIIEPSGKSNFSKIYVEIIELNIELITIDNEARRIPIFNIVIINKQEIKCNINDAIEIYNNIYALLIKTKCFELISNIIFIKQLNTAILIYSINKLITFSSTLRKCIIFLANKKWKIQIINQLNEPITLHLSK